MLSPSSPPVFPTRAEHRNHMLKKNYEKGGKKIPIPQDCQPACVGCFFETLKWQKNWPYVGVVCYVSGSEGRLGTALFFLSFAGKLFRARGIYPLPVFPFNHCTIDGISDWCNFLAAVLRLCRAWEYSLKSYVSGNVSYLLFSVQFYWKPFGIWMNHSGMWVLKEVSKNKIVPIC